MQILLHIGQGKTGTTAIQSFLTHNRHRLLDEGVLFPVPRIAGLPVEIGSHNPVADALTGVDRYPGLTDKQYFDQFFQEARKTAAKLMILSAEHFFGGLPRLYDVDSPEQYTELYTNKITRLKSFLAGNEIRILIYLRPQVEYLASTIGQVIKNQLLVRNERARYLDDQQLFEIERRGLRYTERLDIWKNIIEPTSFRVVPYVRSKLAGGSSITDFLQQSDLKYIQFLPRELNRVKNESLSREFIEVKKILNNEEKAENKERVIIECLNRLSRTSRIGPGYRIEPGIVRQIEEFVDHDNIRLATKYLDEGQVFQARMEYKGDALEPLNEQDIQRAMAAFRQEYRRPAVFVRRVDLALRVFLRKRATVVHAALHQLKRMSSQLRLG